MKQFTGAEYLLIDVGTQFGLDKETFETRIEWAKAHLDELESLVGKAEEPELYMKVVMAVRKAQKGLPTGHMVGLDAICSGIQIMSVMCGCVKGARATGLVDKDVRSDAYTSITKAMERILSSIMNITRKQAKEATMAAFYGSTLVPKRLFGEDTPELKAFHLAAYQVAPGAWDMLESLLASWQAGALAHSWKMPDGFDVRVKVMVKKEVRIEVDELAHSTFTYEYEENEGEASGLSNAANLVHSVDAYIMRSIHRRCNYDVEIIEGVKTLLDREIALRNQSINIPWVNVTPKVIYYCDQYDRSGIADATILPHIGFEDVKYLSDTHIGVLITIVDEMLEHPPFEVVGIHDEYKCHPNHMNVLRKQYVNMLCALADANVVQDLLSQIHGVPGVYKKSSENLSDLIKESNYALC